MITFEVEDLDVYWAELTRRIWRKTCPGVKLRPPTKFPWGRDGRFLLTNNGRIWDAQTGELVRVLENQTKETRSLAISTDGNWVLSGNVDGAARLWEAASGKLIHTFTDFGPDRWTYCFFTYSNERYEPAVFHSGDWFGTPEDAFDIGASYLTHE